MRKAWRSELVIGLLLFFLALMILISPFLQAQDVYNYDDVNAYFAEIIATRDMEEQDASFIRRSYAMSDSYQKAHVYAHKGAMNVEEIAIFEGDDQQAAELVKACEKRVADLKSSFKGYGTTQNEMLEKAQVHRYGNIVICVIADDSAAMLERMEDAR